uniref:Uncharacterized protein n=1 Tax=Rhizophora mucronata TaxID=61149 RepID=A0A2P2NB11_RHIMU
MNGITYNVQ